MKFLMRTYYVTYINNNYNNLYYNYYLYLQICMIYNKYFFQPIKVNDI